VIATKVYGRMRPGPNGAGLSRKAIFAEIDNSLHRLGMDYVDLCAGRGTEVRIRLPESSELPTTSAANAPAVDCSLFSR